jgi:hypothetical protein
MVESDIALLSGPGGYGDEPFGPDTW